MAGRKRSPTLAGYPEKKIRSNGTPYFVYVQPFWIEQIVEGKSEFIKRKVQSDPFDPNVKSSLHAAIQQAGLRVEEAKQKFSGNPIQTKLKKDSHTLRTTSQKYLSTIVKYDRNGNPRPSKPSSVSIFTKNLNRASNTEPKIADVEWRFLTIDILQLHLSNFASTHAAETSEKYRSHLSTLGKFAQEYGYWQENLFTKTRSLRKSANQLNKSTSENLVLQLMEIMDLNSAAKSTSIQLLVGLKLLRLGLRINEVLGLTEDCIDRDDLCVNLKYSLTTQKPQWAGSRDSHVFCDDTKTYASTKRIQITKGFLELIDQSLGYAKFYSVPAFDDGGKNSDRKFIVNNKQGHAWRYDNFLRAIKIVFEKAKVDLRSKQISMPRSNVRYNHIWRNTYAADLVALGADDMTLMYLMRHTDANTSKQVYASARKENLDVYRKYKAKIKAIDGYNVCILEIDHDIEIGFSGFRLAPPYSLYEVRPSRSEKDALFEEFKNL